MTSYELKRANEAAKDLLIAAFVFIFVLPCAVGLAFRVFRVFAGL